MRALCGSRGTERVRLSKAARVVSRATHAGMQPPQLPHHDLKLSDGFRQDLEQCLKPVDGVGKGVPSRVSSEGQVKRGSR